MFVFGGDNVLDKFYEYLHNSTPLSYVFEIFGTKFKCSNFVIEDIIIENNTVYLETDVSDYISFKLNECVTEFIEDSWIIKFKNGILTIFEENDEC